MKRFVIACMAVAVAAYAATAWSAGGATPTEKRLLKDVATLKAQVKKLQTGQSDLEAGLGASIIVSVCGTEIIADDLQGTWQEVDQLAAATQGGKTYFGAQTPISVTIQGQDICSTPGIVRSHALPPTTAQLQSLLSSLGIRNGRINGIQLASH